MKKYIFNINNIKNLYHKVTKYFHISVCDQYTYLYVFENQETVSET